ncbi:MAG TPA: response regulator [Clostridiales bacterium]|nr:response regulator [Clostridiales bacterium]
MKIMAVDDERLALSEFRDTCNEIEGIESIETFSNPMDALGYVATEKIDVAFLDIEMPMVRGIELAERLKKIDPNIKIIFVTGYAQYAFDAFGVNAVDYVLKPYTTDMIRRALEKASLIKDKEKDPKITVKTFGYFDVFVQGKPIVFSSAKSKELLALLVDRKGGVVSTEQAINVLWNDRDYDEKVQSLFRKVLKSLRGALEDVGVSDIFIDNRNQRAVDSSKFACDYYDLLNNKADAENEYFGKYMTQYEWARETERMLDELVENRK